MEIPAPLCEGKRKSNIEGGVKGVELISGIQIRRELHSKSHIQKICITRGICSLTKPVRGS